MRSSVRRPIARGPALALVTALALGSFGCNTYADSLSRAQRAFEQSEHERALAILRVLEPDARRLSDSDRAKYCYLRGLTDYRIGYRLEARHWLSLTAAVVKETPDALPADWTKRLKEALKDLDEAVYTGGIASLSNVPAAHKAAAKDDDDEAEPPPAASSKPAPKPADE
jgi:hypothetical protein